MATYSATAIVLRRTKLGETDLILTMLDSSGRIIKAVAKGARKPKSKLAGASALFAGNDLLLHQGNSLDIVSESRPAFRATHIPSEYRATVGASVVAEFVLKTHWVGEVEPRLYDMTLACLSALDGIAAVSSVSEAARDAAIDSVVLAFLIKGLAMLGYRPTVDGCVECGMPLALCSPDQTSGTEACWSPEDAGVRCATCAPGAPSSAMVPIAAVEWLGVLLNSTFAAVVAHPPHAQALDDLFVMVADLLRAHGDTSLNAFDTLVSERVSPA